MRFVLLLGLVCSCASGPRPVDSDASFTLGEPAAAFAPSAACLSVRVRQAGPLASPVPALVRVTLDGVAREVRTTSGDAQGCVSPDLIGARRSAATTSGTVVAVISGAVTANEQRTVENGSVDVVVEASAPGFQPARYTTTWNTSRPLEVALTLERER